MLFALRLVVLLFFPLLAAASQEVACSIEQGGDELAVVVREERDALGGYWQEMGEFSFRALLAAPAGKKAWLLIEVLARAADGDFHIISSQKVFAPFVTGRMEVVEPRLGRILRYECGVAN